MESSGRNLSSAYRRILFRLNVSLFFFLLETRIGNVKHRQLVDSGKLY